MRTRIRGGRVIDPARGLDAVGDVLIRGDRIVTDADSAARESESGSASDSDERLIDARGCVVMAGGIDLHTHIGGGKVSLARMLLQDQFPGSHPGRSEFLPAASVTGERYLEMGYTTCFEPAMIPCNARSAHAEMAEVAGIDTGGYCLLGNDEWLLRMIADRVPQAMINDYVAYVVTATQAIAVKVVNAGGISAFKFGTRMLDVDTPHPVHGVTPSQVVRVLCRAVHEIGLAHPLHVHASNLGVPGNIESTLATIRAADGLPIHLTHAQFHCYGDDGPYGMSSAAAKLIEAMRQHPNVTIDVGQVMFGQTVTISADTMHQHRNRGLARPRKSVLVDVECEAGCGVVPFRYRRRRFVHSLQWAIGLELFLMADDPGRVFLTTDHPNGGPFTTYPHLIRLLGDRTFRETALAEIHPDAAASSELAGIDREYRLDQIATMTRSAPAAILGLGDRGQLGNGSIADVVVYERHDDLDRMFRRPKYVFRQGRLIRSTIDGRADDDERCRIEPITLVAEVDCESGSAERAVGRFDPAVASAMRHLRISDDEMGDVIGSRVIRHRGTGRTR